MSLVDLKVLAWATVVIAFVSLLAMAQQRGHRIDVLELELKAARADLALRNDEYARLKASAAAAGRASAALGRIQKAETLRRERISQLAREAKPIERPGVAVDEQSSRRAIEILNVDLFAPFDDGLRGQNPAASGSASGALPGPADAFSPAAEP